MEQKMVLKIMEECGELYDTLPDDASATWTFFIKVNEIVSKYKGVDCLMHVNFANGGVTQGMCVITDWKPGALAFQSDDGVLPKIQLIFPEDYVSFMEEIEPIFEVQYPEFPKDQE